ncbi:calcium/sodium antiporter [Eubacteriales bacterium OttesenSCG-928-N13]|nr:calcium/sodium antiporter [Eubacteriales bacterium OttesenSCG-928-N13]
MPVIVVVLLFLLGLGLIIKGGDLFVDAATWIAEASGIPKFIVGATVVSLATTMPELLVSLIAVMNGSYGMAIGNAVGSVTANTGLIMGISVFCIPAIIKRTEFAPKGILMVVACLLLWIASLSGVLSTWGAILMLLLFIVFIAMNLKDARASMGTESAKSDVDKSRKTTIINIAKFVLGAAGTVVGARLLVDNASILARLIGIPESVIGVTLVAVGTSLPELVTTITAIRKKQSELSIGNIIGANIIDLTVILPICSLISGGQLPMLNQTLRLDLPVCLGIGLLAVVPTMIAGRFKRVQGIIMLCCYAVYVGVLCFGPQII